MLGTAVRHRQSDRIEGWAPVALFVRHEGLDSRVQPADLGRGDGKPILQVVEELARAVDAGAEAPPEEREPQAAQHLQRALYSLEANFLLRSP